jgi:hypothetical protein
MVLYDGDRVLGAATIEATNVGSGLGRPVGEPDSV